MQNSITGISHSPYLKSSLPRPPQPVSQLLATSFAKFTEVNLTIDKLFKVLLPLTLMEEDFTQPPKPRNYILCRAGFRPSELPKYPLSNKEINTPFYTMQAFYLCFLKNILALKDGTWIVSDYGLPYLYPLFHLLFKAESPKHTIFALDRVFNVVHQRGDLAAFFVEDGSKTLLDIANA